MKRGTPLPWLVLVVLALLVAGCRPAIADNGDTGDAGDTSATEAPAPSFGNVNASDLPSLAAPADAGPATPEPSLIEIPTAVPAQALQPATQVDVQVRLFHGLETTDSALLYADALNHYTAVNLVVDVSPPIAGYDIFAVDPAPDVVPVWVGTVADVAAAAGAGVTLEAVGELSGRDATVLVTPRKGGAKSVGALKGKILVDGPQAAAALQAVGLPSGATADPPDDPGAPFDPSALLDGSSKAAAVSGYEAWARIQEALVAAGLDPASWVATPLTAADAPILGELIWVQPSDLQTADLKSAVAAFLGAVAQAQVECRDNLDDCTATAATQSDRTPDGIAYSINELDKTLFPTADGILHMDPAAWVRTIAMLQAAKVPGVESLTYSNDLVTLVLDALASLDIHGTNWKPENRPLFP